MLPTDKQPGETIDVDFGGLTPSTHYWVGVRALDSCNRPGPHAVVEMTTSKIHYTTLPPVSPFNGQCFIATAAWGSALEPTVSAMRRARDQLLADVPLFSVAADLYGRSGPAAAGGPPSQRHGPGARPAAAGTPRRPPPKRSIPAK